MRYIFPGPGPTHFVRLLSVFLFLSVPMAALAQTGTGTDSTVNVEKQVLPTEGDKTSPFNRSKIYPSGEANDIAYDVRQSSNQPISVLSATRNVPAAKAPAHVYEFTDFIRNSVGVELPFFGRDLSESGFNTSAPVDPLTVPVGYQVGPGDELIIRAWGQIDIDYQGRIDRSGTIFLPQIGEIMVAGTRLGDLQKLIQVKVSKLFKNFELTVTLGALRQIQYYVSGFVKYPGLHTAPSTVTAIHGLLIAGGADTQGDLRRIELRRGKDKPLIIDAYKLLAEGNNADDPQMMPGDVLFVPAAKGLVASAGSIKRPAIYLMSEDMTVGDLIRLSGDFSISIKEPLMRLERFKDGRRYIEHVKADKDGLALPLRDSDLLVVLPASPRFEEIITLRGNVAQPLRQPWREGMKISDFLNNEDALIRPGDWMKRNDTNRLSDMRVSGGDRDFNLSFPDVEWEYAAVERIDKENFGVRVIPFNLRLAMRKDAENDLVLESGDSVIIFSKSDFIQPRAKQIRLVRIEGEVNSPGIYPVAVNETLTEALERAGGVTDQAYLYGTVLVREKLKILERERVNQAADILERDYILTVRETQIGVETILPSSEPEMRALKEMIEKIRSTPVEGRLALNLDPGISKPDQFPEIQLEEQDKIVIPPRPDSVLLVGAIFRQGSVAWHKGWNTDDYIKKSGGTRDRSDMNQMVVIRADGTVEKGKGWFSMKTASVNPGDTIVVPESVNRGNKLYFWKNWSQVVFNLGIGAAAIKFLGVFYWTYQPRLYPR